MNLLFLSHAGSCRPYWRQFPPAKREEGRRTGSTGARGMTGNTPRIRMAQAQGGLHTSGEPVDAAM